VLVPWMSSSPLDGQTAPIRPFKMEQPMTGDRGRATGV
jgi:hypothetical protein